MKEKEVSLHTLGGLQVKGLELGSNKKALLLLTYLLLEAPQNRWPSGRLHELLWSSEKFRAEKENSFTKLHNTIAKINAAYKGISTDKLIWSADSVVHLRLDTNITCDVQDLLNLCKNENIDWQKIQELYREGPFLDGIDAKVEKLRVSSELVDWIGEKRQEIANTFWQTMWKVSEEKPQETKKIIEEAYRSTRKELPIEFDNFMKLYNHLSLWGGELVSHVLKQIKGVDKELGEKLELEYKESRSKQLEVPLGQGHNSTEGIYEGSPHEYLPPKQNEEANKPQEEYFQKEQKHDEEIKQAGQNNTLTGRESPAKHFRNNDYELNKEPLAGEFIGRDKEIEAIKDLLAHKRLVTLLGMGGTGKTRLALEICQCLKEEEVYSDGIEILFLEAISPEQFLSSLTQKFGLQASGNALEELGNYLKNKNTLLLLDNFEHLLDQHHVLTSILSAPQVSILVSSRHRLNIEAEQLYELEGLSYPQSNIEEVQLSEAENFEAVHLFIIRRQKVQHDFKLDEHNYFEILQLCQKLCGMPLAIELAAGMRHKSPNELLIGLNNLDFFKSTSRSKADRHKSIRAMFDFSWQFLSTLEQKVFMQLSVFESGFKHKAGAEIIEGFEEKVVVELLDKSLLQIDRQSGRYQLHPLLKEYAKDKLAKYPESSMD